MNSKTYSVIVLLVLIVGEVSGILGQQLECDFWFVPIMHGNTNTCVLIVAFLRILYQVPFRHLGSVLLF